MACFNAVRKSNSLTCHSPDNNYPSNIAFLAFICYFSVNPNPVSKVTLSFPSIHLLWAFVQVANLSFVEINLPKMQLTCQCNEKDVSMAITQFEAIVV